MRKQTLVSKFEIELSEVISDEADAYDAEQIERQLRDAIMDIFLRGVSRGFVPVGKMRVVVAQDVEY